MPNSPDAEDTVPAAGPEIAISDDEEPDTGYVMPPPRPTEELTKLDAEDESLQKWKKSLGLDEVARAKNANDSRRVVPLKMTVVINKGEEIVVDCSGSNKDEVGKFSIKEGTDFRIFIKTIIQNEIAPRLRYRHKVRRMGVLVEKYEKIIGSYSPRVDPYDLEACISTTPSGMLARGSYMLTCELLDDDCQNKPHMVYECEMKITK